MVGDVPIVLGISRPSAHIGRCHPKKRVFTATVVAAMTASRCRPTNQSGFRDSPRKFSSRRRRVRKAAGFDWRFFAPFSETGSSGLKRSLEFGTGPGEEPSAYPGATGRRRFSRPRSRLAYGFRRRASAGSRPAATSHQSIAAPTMRSKSGSSKFAAVATAPAASMSAWARLVRIPIVAMPAVEAD
jgi:hypothetical protein